MHIWCMHIKQQILTLAAHVHMCLLCTSSVHCMFVTVCAIYTSVRGSTDLEHPCMVTWLHLRTHHLWRTIKEVALLSEDHVPHTPAVSLLLLLCRLSVFIAC